MLRRLKITWTTCGAPSHTKSDSPLPALAICLPERCEIWTLTFGVVPESQLTLTGMVAERSPIWARRAVAHRLTISF